MNRAYRGAEQRLAVLQAHARSNPLPRPEVLLDHHLTTPIADRVHVYADRFGGKVRVSISIHDPALHIPYDPAFASKRIAVEAERIAREVAGRYGEVSRVLCCRSCWQAIVDHPAANAATP